MRKYFLIPALMIALNLHANDEGKAPVVGQFVWNELATPNAQAAKTFYKEMFGWEFSEVSTAGEDKNYTMIKKDNRDIGGIWAIPTNLQGQIQPHWLPYIMVDNVEKSVEKARQNGATVIRPVQKAGDKGFFAIIRDPSGAEVAFWQAVGK